MKSNAFLFLVTYLAFSNSKEIYTGRKQTTVDNSLRDDTRSSKKYNVEESILSYRYYEMEFENSNDETNSREREYTLSSTHLCNKPAGCAGITDPSQALSTSFNDLQLQYCELMTKRKISIENYSEASYPANEFRFQTNAKTILLSFHSLAKFYLPVLTPLERHDNSDIETISEHHSELDTFHDDTSNASRILEGIDKVKGPKDQKQIRQTIEEPILSPECHKDVATVYSAFNVSNDWSLSKEWSLLLFDSWGKHEDGALVGNQRSLGFVEECLSLTADTEERSFTGQYCLVSTGRIENTSFLGMIPTAYGTCIPSSCTSDELKSSLVHQLEPLHHMVQTVSCQQRHKEHSWDTWAIIGSAVIACLTLVVALITVVDVVKPGKKISPFFLSFSAAENFAKILAVKINVPGEISCIHAIRVMSICWVMLGHHYAYISSYGVNILMMPQMISGWAFQIVWSGYKAVDTFFVIGGMLVTKSLLNANFCAENKSSVVRPNENITTENEPANTSSVGIDNNAFEGSSSSNIAIPVLFNPSPENVLLEKLRKQGFITTASRFITSYALYLLHRIVRMWPTMFLITMFCAGPSSLFMSGPYLGRYQDEYLSACRTNWWVDLTLFSNVIFVVTGKKADANPDFGPVDSCISHSWYLAVDFQLYLLMPLLILPIKVITHKMLYLLCLILVSCLIPGLIVTLKDGIMPAMLLTLNSDASIAYSRAIYMMPYARASPYLVGAVCAILLHRGQHLQKRDGKAWLRVLYGKYPQVSRFHPRVLCWVTITIVALAVVFGLSGTNEIRLPEHEQKLGPFAAFCYAAFTSAAWAVVVGWVILVCALGLAGPLNLLLSHPMWQPLSRVTFPVYLISLPIQKMVFYSFQRDIYLSHTYIILSYCGVVVLSFLSSFFISVVAESPFVNLLKLMKTRPSS